MIRFLLGVLLFILFAALAENSAYDRLYALGMFVAMYLIILGVTARTNRKNQNTPHDASPRDSPTRSSLGQFIGMKHIQTDYQKVKPVPWYSSITDEFGSFLLEKH